MPVVVLIKTPVDLGENINLFNGGLRAAVFYLDQPCEEAMNNAAVCRSIGESPLLKKRYLLLYIRCILLLLCKKTGTLQKQNRRVHILGKQDRR